MAKQVGSAFIGAVDGYSFYYNRLDGYLLRATGGVTSEKYRTEERYRAARDNSSEFSVVSRNGSSIRKALAPFLQTVKDGSMVNRLNRELVALKQKDRLHKRGQRRPAVRMADPLANRNFRIFQFNDAARVYDITEHYPCAETIHRPGMTPRCEIKALRLKPQAFPEGAACAGITLVYTMIDLENGRHRTVSSPMTVTAMNEAANLAVAIPKPPSSVGIVLVSLQILFFRKENGDLVQLKGKVHAMGIVGVHKYESKENTPTGAEKEITGRACTAPKVRKSGGKRRTEQRYRLLLQGQGIGIYSDRLSRNGTSGEYELRRAREAPR